MGKTNRKLNKPAVIIGILAVAALIMVIVLMALPGVKGNKRFISAEHGYSLIFDSGILTYERVVLNQTEGTTMDRFYETSNKGVYYMAVTDIDPNTDLQEAIDQLESDDSYHFEFLREDNVTFGSAGYSATKLYYTEETDGKKVFVTYYYDEAHGIMITICTDEEHQSIFTTMLETMRME